MIELKQICEFLDGFAPTQLAEDWDNVGLLVGDADARVAKVMTCLTVTTETASEAIEQQADLIVTHHPLPFRSIKKLTTQQTATRMLWDLIRAGVAIYSPHTGFDSAAQGINQMVCQRMGLQNIQPLQPLDAQEPSVGAGRFGQTSAATKLSDFIETAKANFDVQQIQYVGDLSQNVSKVASACGSGGSFIDRVIEVGCDTFITGETTFHTCLEAKARRIALILLGHYSSERFAIEELATVLKGNFEDLDVWAAKKESDPVSWV